MPWAVAAAAVAAGGAIYAANKSSNAQEDAAQTASDTQTGMYSQTRADQAPWRAAGGQALDQLSKFYGLGGINSGAGSNGLANGTDTSSGYTIGADGSIHQGLLPGDGVPTYQSSNQPDFSSIIQNTPGYQFQFQQGESAVNNNLAARGLLQSGAAGKALTQYGQGVASQYTGQYVNGLQSLAGLGQTANQATGQAGMNAANQISSNQIYAGNAAATGYANQSNAINQGLSGIVQGYGYYNGNQNYNPQAGSLSNPGVAGAGSYQYGGVQNPDTGGGYIVTGLN